MTKKNFVNELRDLLGFLSSVWGLLTGVSVLFPLSNELFSLIPRQGVRNERSVTSPTEDFGFLVISPSLVTVMATLVTLFILFQVIASRDRICAFSRRRVKLSAYRDFFLGLASFGAYFVYFNNLSGSLPGHHLYPEPFGDFVLLLFYCLFFSLITRSFMLLALREYLTDRYVVSPRSAP